MHGSNALYTLHGQIRGMLKAAPCTALCMLCLLYLLKGWRTTWSFNNDLAMPHC